MAINELSAEIEKEEVERRKRYPLLEIVNNREEIRKIAEDTLSYVGDLYPSLKDINYWEVVPRMAIELMKQYFSLAESKKAADKCVFVSIGEFMSIGIESGKTLGADKEGTLNPIITIGPELAYDNENADANKLKKTEPVFSAEDQETLDFVCKHVQNTLKTRFGILVEDYHDIARIALSFFRMIRQYLVDHRDDEEYGIDIDLGNVLDIGVSKYTADDGSMKYCIQFAPGQTFKVGAKDDDSTEKTE